MPNKTIYLPEDLNDILKRMNINLSKFVQEKLLELVPDSVCPTCGRLLPKK